MRARLGHVAAFLSAAVVASAQAQSDVIESTAAAKAAAVERAAKELRDRQTREPAPLHVHSPDGLVRGKSAAGVDYVCGGVTAEERRALYAMRADYNLWVATVARPSGAYLSDVRLRIMDLSDKRVLVEQTMYGPWFLATLPPGRYEVSATVFAEDVKAYQTLTTQVRAVRGAMREAVLRFASSADVLPEPDDALSGNPFAASTPRR